MFNKDMKIEITSVISGNNRIYYLNGNRKVLSKGIVCLFVRLWKLDGTSYSGNFVTLAEDNTYQNFHHRDYIGVIENDPESSISYEQWELRILNFISTMQKRGMMLKPIDDIEILHIAKRHPGIISLELQ